MKKSRNHNSISFTKSAMVPFIGEILKDDESLAESVTSSDINYVFGAEE